MKLIIGLGNPGREYECTRHNAGFMAMDAFADDIDANWKNDAKRKALVATSDVNGKKVILAKPQTFMNLSGDATTALLSFYKIEPKNILLVHDDMDIEPGRIQFKLGGSPAGHNGVTSVYERLGTKEIQRLRIGIGRPQGRASSEDWVLSELSTEDAPNALDISAAMRDWIEGGMVRASDRWNKH
jgi:PTH1 family peptidyl-tRNA hydrolase